MNGTIVIYILLFAILVDSIIHQWRKKTWLSNLLNKTYSTFTFVTHVFIFILVFRGLFLEPFIIPSSSMVPNLLVGDYIFVNKMSYGYGRYSLPLEPWTFQGRIGERPIKRGDVVVFRYPPNPKESYVKRIVGIAGDKIQVANGLLLLNGKAVAKTTTDNYSLDDNSNFEVSAYLETIKQDNKNDEDKTYEVIEINGNVGNLDNTQTYEVPAGHYFAMGDNRDNSLDSRVASPFGIGMIPKENIIGRVVFVLFSINRQMNNVRWNRFFKGVQ